VSAKSSLAVQMDAIQGELQPLLKARGFRKRGRTLNRLTEDGLTQVINYQMGPFEPPGAGEIPGFRDNLYGLFTMNLGVYVPEVDELLSQAKPRSFIAEPYCCVRARLGAIAKEDPGDRWWAIALDPVLIRELYCRLEHDGLPFLEHFASRDAILREWDGHDRHAFAGRPPRIVSAMIQFKRGNSTQAKELLEAQARETHVAGHRGYVIGLAETLGLGPLDS